MIRSILVNVRALAHRFTGVERYTHELTRRMKGKIITLSPRLRLNGGIGHVWEQVELPRRVGSKDVLWSPANSGPLSVTNQVVTIHDLSPLEHPGWFRPAFAAWYGFLIPRLAKRARLILTHSEFSKSRIVDRLRIPEEKIFVVQPGVDTEKFHPRAGQAAGIQARYPALPNRYILFVGSLEPRKNLQRLVKAWQLFQSSRGMDQAEVELILAGSPGKSFRFIDTERWSEGVRLLGYVGDIHLPALYSGALAFIQPSLYEGFGLPVLEAMACGIPVLASKDTALAEAAGEAALLFDPLSVEEIASALQEVIENDKLRQNLCTKGLERVQELSWERAAGKVLEVIHACV
jgi:glycosyltransferase involved in cell wall biosynthesis